MTKQQFNRIHSAHGMGRGYHLATAVGGVLLASTAFTSAQAVALGEVHVRSSLGEPLVAEVSLPAGDRGNLEVVPAPAAAYAQHGLQAPERLGRITTTVVRTADGRQALRITSTGPVNDPIVDLLVQARDQSGRLDRQLTLLVNPAQMGGARTGGAAAPLRATRQPAGVAVQDVHSPTPSRAKRPAHKKKAPSKTRAAAVHKPVVAAVRSKTRVLPDAANERELAAAAPKDGAAARAGESASATLPIEKATAVASPQSIAAAGTAAAGAAALDGGTANAPVANASDATPAPEPPISASGDSTAPAAEVVSEAAPATGSDAAMPVEPKAPAPAEPSAGAERWGMPAALVALLLAGGLIWQRRQRSERLRDAGGADDVPDDDREVGQSPVMAAAAVVAPLRPEVRAAAAPPVIAAVEPTQEPLPDFGVTRAVPEEDPVAQADVFLSAGKVDEARAALEEGLWLDGDHIAILLKLLSLHADRGDVGAFNESAARLAQETARSRQAWRRACEIGHRLDPANALYAGDAPPAVGAPADRAGGGSDDDHLPPGTPPPGIARTDPAAGSSTGEAALPFALEPMEIGDADRSGPAVPVEGVHADASADARAQQPAVALDGTSPGSESTAGFSSARDPLAAGAEPSEDGIATELEVTPPEAPRETSLQAAAIAPDIDRGGQPREDSRGMPGAVDAGGFDQLPTLLQRATARADGGDRQGALELATEIARLLAALRNEALALAPNGYA